MGAQEGSSAAWADADDDNGTASGNESCGKFEPKKEKDNMFVLDTSTGNQLRGNKESPTIIFK